MHSRHKNKINRRASIQINMINCRWIKQNKKNGNKQFNMINFVLIFQFLFFGKIYYCNQIYAWLYFAIFDIAYYYCVYIIFMRPTQETQNLHNWPTSSTSEPEQEVTSIRYPSLYYPPSQSNRHVRQSFDQNIFRLQSSDLSHSGRNPSMISSIPQENSQPHPTRTSQFFSFFQQGFRDKDEVNCSMLLKDLSQDHQKDENQKDLPNCFQNQEDIQLKQKTQKESPQEKMSRIQIFMSAFRFQRTEESKVIIQNTDESNNFPPKQRKEGNGENQKIQKTEKNEKSLQIQYFQKNQIGQDNESSIQKPIKYETSRPEQEKQQQIKEKYQNQPSESGKIQSVSESNPKTSEVQLSNSFDNLESLQVNKNPSEQKKENTEGKEEREQSQKDEKSDNREQNRVEDQDDAYQDSVQIEKTFKASLIVNKQEQKAQKKEEVNVMKQPPAAQEDKVEVRAVGEQKQQWQSQSEPYEDSVAVQQTENEIVIGDPQEEQEEEDQNQSIQQPYQSQQINSVQVRKSLIIGLYTFNKLTPELISSLEQTMVQYYPSNYFHVGPRGQILYTIYDLVKEIKQSATYTPEQINTKQSQLVGVLINQNKIDAGLYKLAFQASVKALGNEIRLLWGQNQMAEIGDIVSSYGGSNYFHVGKRRYIFNEVAEVIKLVNKVRQEIVSKLASINVEEQDDGSQDEGVPEDEDENDDDYDENQDDQVEDQDDEEEEEDDEYSQLPPANNQHPSVPLGQQSIYSSASTQQSFEDIPNYNLEDLKSFECGKYLKQHMSPQLVASLRSTISKYDSSNYFHVGPRYELLGFISGLAQFVANTQAKAIFPSLPQNSDTNKLIKAGTQLRNYITSGKISQIKSTCGSYFSSNYFHVGPRYSILGDARKIIKIYQQMG